MSTPQDQAPDLVPPMLRTVAYMVGVGAAAGVAPTTAAGWSGVASVLGVIAAICLAVAVAYRPTR